MLSAVFFSFVIGMSFSFSASANDSESPHEGETVFYRSCTYGECAVEDTQKKAIFKSFADCLEEIGDFETCYNSGENLARDTRPRYRLDLQNNTVEPLEVGTSFFKGHSGDSVTPLSSGYETCQVDYSIQSSSPLPQSVISGTPTTTQSQFVGGGQNVVSNVPA